ncbi:MAG: hypothetical protein ABIH26_01545 [Candidatus Eisenbacteria bacterium]
MPERNVGRSRASRVDSRRNSAVGRSWKAAIPAERSTPPAKKRAARARGIAGSTAREARKQKQTAYPMWISVCGKPASAARESAPARNAVLRAVGARARRRAARIARGSQAAVATNVGCPIRVRKNGQSSKARAPAAEGPRASPKERAQR